MFIVSLWNDQVIKSSQNLEHRQILEAQTYGQAKELARDYQKTKVMLYKRLQDLGYGSWELMQKPPEMNFFSWTSALGDSLLVAVSFHLENLIWIKKLKEGFLFYFWLS